MNTRQQVEHRFKQATQGERFSQAYCIDRILEVIQMAVLEEARWWAGTHHEAKWATGSCVQCDRIEKLEAQVSVVQNESK